MKRLARWLSTLWLSLAEAFRLLAQDPTWYEEIEDRYNLF